MPTPTPPLTPPPLDQLGPNDDAPMTEKQAMLLRDLTDRKGMEFDGSLTQAQARARIEALQDMPDK